MADFLGHMHMTVDKWIFSAFQQAILRAFATLEHAISSTDKSTVSVMYAGMQRMMANMMHQVKGQSAQHTVDIESTSSGNQLTPVSENFTDDAPTSSGFESVENITGDASTSSGRELICSGENFIDDASTSSGFESTPLNNILDNGTVFENMPSYEESIYNDGTNRNVPTSSGIDFEAICDDGKSLNAPISSIETTENNYGEPENGTGTNIAESQAHHEYYIQYNIDELVPDTASGSENGAVGGNDDATKPNNKKPDWFEVCTFTNADDYDKYLEEEHFAKCSSTERNKTTSVYLRCNRVKKKGVQWQLYSIAFKPRILIADAANAIANGFKDVFLDVDVQIIMCWFHVKQALCKRLGSNEHRAAILEDIGHIHLAHSVKMFSRSVELFDEKWSEKLPDFCAYFKRYWVDSHSGWFVGFAHKCPSTNNHLEGCNSGVKRCITYRELMPSTKNCSNGKSRNRRIMLLRK